ncbi:PadR family transcriptional regulator [Catalinimonas alkaloidigena]|nr:helix-turn-helix transcriptional regulator [Catalinimonas alkaloidigena]
MRGSYLGEFEELVLLTVAVLYDEAYGVAISEEIEQQTGRAASISAVHAALNRLSDKGMVTSHLGGATAERGGRRKRFFTVTPAGSKVLHEIRHQRQQLWAQIPPQALRWKMG